MPPLNAPDHASSTLHRTTQRPIWDQIDPGSRITPVAESSLAADGMGNSGRMTTSAKLPGWVSHPGQVDVSSVFTKAWKREIYDAWVDLDLLPAFMRGFHDDFEPESFELPWYLKLRDGEVRWEARTTECVPGERISWEGGDHEASRNRGCVTFVPEGRAVTRVRVNLQFAPSGDPAITDETLKRIEVQLRDTLALLHLFLAPHALPPAPASL